MRHAVATVVAALVTLSLSAATTAAPQEKTARGKVTALSGASITLDVQGQSMTFVVENTTNVIARGAGTMTREMEKTGAKPKLTDILKVGENAEVSYAETGGTMTAKTIRAVATAPEAESAAASKRLEGVVSEVSATSLTVKPASGDAVQFMADAKLRVTGAGLGTMSREKQEVGAVVKLTDAVAIGDTVEVTYTTMGDMKHASAVRVVKKKM